MSADAQRTAARAVANRVRRERSELKAELARTANVGETRQAIAAVVADPPPAVDSMAIYDLLKAGRGIGHRATRRYLIAAGVGERKQIRDLTDRQRCALIATLGGGHTLRGDGGPLPSPRGTSTRDLFPARRGGSGQGPGTDAPTGEGPKFPSGLGPGRTATSSGQAGVEKQAAGISTRPGNGGDAPSGLEEPAGSAAVDPWPASRRRLDPAVSASNQKSKGALCQTN